MLQAYANQGRWVVECPECRSALKVCEFGGPVLFPHFGCIECGFGFDPAVWIVLVGVPLPVRALEIASLIKDMQAEYVMPTEAKEIETELLRRPRPDNRNWLPGETLADLLIENVKRGLD